MREVTRLKLTSYHQLMEDVVVNKYYFAPQFEGVSNLEEKGIGEVAKVVLYPHEIYTGIIPKIQKLSESSFYTKAAAKIQSDVESLNTQINYDQNYGDGGPDATASDEMTSLLESYGARVAHFHLLTARYASRSGSVMGRFMPRLVAGFPAAIYQKGYDNRSSIRTALYAGLKDYTAPKEVSKLSQEIFDKTKPIHYQCMIQSITHTISQQQANTSVSFTHARSHKTDSATDDLLSTMAKSGGFAVNSAATGAASTAKEFSTLSIGTSATHSKASALFQICDDFYDQLFLTEHSTITIKKIKEGAYVHRLAENYLTSTVVDEITPKVNSAKNLKESKGTILGFGCLTPHVYLSGNDVSFNFSSSAKQGRVYYYNDSGITYTIQNIVHTGIEMGILYEAPEGVSEYAVGPEDKSLFSIEVTGSFTEALPWQNPIFIRVPIKNGDDYAKDLFKVSSYTNRSGIDFNYDTKELPTSIDVRKLFKEDGAEIVCGTTGLVSEDTFVHYEYVRSGTDPGSFEGYLYVRLIPRFTSIKAFYGTIEATTDVATTTETKEPWEVTIRPGWFAADSYSNTNIGKTYEKMLGCTSIISKYNLSPKEGYSTVSTEQAIDKIIGIYDTVSSDKIRWIHQHCSRGHANLIEVLGKKESGKLTDYESGGFHSAAVGSFEQLEGLDIVGKNLGSLLNPQLQKVQINASENKIDPRQSRRNAILYYLSTILSRGIRS